MKLTYDASIDTAYIHLTDVRPGGVLSSFECDPPEAKGTINLDFDANGRLVGFEIANASKVLPAEALNARDP